MTGTTHCPRCGHEFVEPLSIADAICSPIPEEGWELLGIVQCPSCETTLDVTADVAPDISEVETLE